jgi:osmoprotectant transport system permease protein
VSDWHGDADGNSRYFPSKNLRAIADGSSRRAGLIDALDRFALVDNRRYFPPYDAVPVARTDTLPRYPAVRRVV